jgi:hypothetical protein
MLSDGRVLVAGGRTSENSVLASAEVFDPKTSKFSRAGDMHEARWLHIAALLPSGKVLVAGGAPDVAGKSELSSTEIYDPAARSFSPAAKMNEGRMKLPDATALLDGRVMISGGAASAEVYDTRSNTFHTVSGTMDSPRFFSAAIQLMDGSFRIFGGYDSSGVSTAKTWTYHP